MVKAKDTRFNCNPGCPVEATVNLLDGKWKSMILWHLFSDGILRFNEIKKRIPNVTQRMLTNQLRELEEDGLIIRTVYAQVPPKVEYQLSELGKSLQPVLMTLKEWGDQHIHLFPAYSNPVESTA